MSAETHKQSVRRTFEGLFSRGDLSLADEVVSPDFVNHDAPPGTPAGPEGMRRIVMTLRTAFPDLHYEIKEMLGEGDLVAVRTIMFGTHNGPFFGIPATGRPVVQEQLHLIRFVGSTAVEHRVVRDDLGLMRQLGVIPEPALWPSAAKGSDTLDGGSATGRSRLSRP